MNSTYFRKHSTTTRATYRQKTQLKSCLDDSAKCRFRATENAGLENDGLLKSRTPTCD